MDFSDAGARVRHDLGRYVALQTRFVGVDGPVDALRDALRSDLGHTRRGPDGDHDVAAVWAACRADLVGVDPALLAPLDRRVAALAAGLAGLSGLDAAAVRALAAEALGCAEDARSLHRALTSGG